MNRSDPFIDFLRALGILQVVLFHIIHGILRFAPRADIPDFLTRFSAVFGFFWQPVGVDLIFVVSTYLLGRSLWRENALTGHIDVRAYLVKRVSRILPLYFLAVLVYGAAQGDGLRDILLSLTFLGYLVGDFNVVPVGWTMEVMMMVYLALPYLVRLISKTSRPILVASALVIASVLVRAVYLWWTDEDATILLTHLFMTGDPTPAGFNLYFRPWFRLPSFLVGLALAVVVETAKNRPVPRGPAMFAAVALIWFTTFLPLQSPDAWPYLIFGQGFFVVYWAAQGALFATGIAVMISLWETGDKSLRFPGPWTAISQRIFGIYLFHMPMILIGAVIVFRSTDTTVLGQAQLWQIVTIFGIASALSYGLSALLYRWIEIPAQTWVRKYNLRDPI